MHFYFREHCCFFFSKRDLHHWHIFHTKDICERLLNHPVFDQRSCGLIVDFFFLSSIFPYFTNSIHDINSPIILPISWVNSFTSDLETSEVGGHALSILLFNQTLSYSSVSVTHHQWEAVPVCTCFLVRVRVSVWPQCRVNVCGAQVNFRQKPRITWVCLHSALCGLCSHSHDDAI